MINGFLSHRERWSLIDLPDFLLLLSLGVELAADLIPCGTGKSHRLHMPHSSPEHSSLNNSGSSRPGDKSQVVRSHTL